MAYHGRDLRPAAQEPLDLGELLRLLGAPDEERARTDAVACFLVGGEGWEAALQRLHGAFAESTAGLTHAQPE